MNNNILRKCNLCPRNCNIDRYKSVGYCNGGSKIKIAYYSLHMWEEPIISGSCGSGTIFFSNCNLKCLYCQNKKISAGGYGKEISINKFVDICLELQEKKAHNINLVTPTHYVPLIIKGINKAKEKGLNIPVVYNTSSYENVNTIRLVKNTVDIYLADFKYYDNKYGNMYSNVNNYCDVVKESIKEMYNNVGKYIIENNIMKKGLIVRILLLPDLIEDAKRIIKYLYDTYKDNIIISIMNQYTVMEVNNKYLNLNRKVTEEEYNEVINYACDLGVTKAFIQEGDTADISFIPEFNINCLE